MKKILSILLLLMFWTSSGWAATKTITDFPALSPMADADEFVVWDIDPGATRKVTKDVLFSSPGAIGDTTPSTGAFTTLTATTLGGPLDINNENLTNVDIDSGDISGTDITVGAGKTLDVSAGTLTLANDQISGDKIEGGTIGTVRIGSLTLLTDLAIVYGGTGTGFLTDHGVLVGSGTGAITALAVGTTGQILRGATGADPAWTTATYPATTTANKILYSSSANTIGEITTGNSGLLVTSAGGVPSIATDIPTAVTIGSAYVYRVGGTDVAVTDGGTNKSAWTQYAIPYASTTTVLSEIGIGTAGQYLKVKGTADGYEWGIPAGDITSVVAGSGLIGGGTSGDVTLNVAGNSGVAGSIGTMSIAADTIGVDLGTTSITAYRGDYGNTAYTDRMKWDGGATGLVAATGRTSLGLGTAALRNAEDTLTDGSNLPDGAAIKAYGDANWSGGGAPAFNAITTGTNTTATMTVGTGGTITYTPDGVVNANQFKGVTVVDSTEFTYLDNVTSAIQTQLNAKQASHAYLTDIASITANQGDIIYFNGTDWVDLAPGTSGKYLKTQGAAANPIWDTPAVGRPVYNAATYSGTDQQKIQAAVNDAVTNSGVALIPGGTWTVTTGITVSGGCMIYGDGKNETIVTSSTNGANIFHITSTSAVLIQDMWIGNTGSPTSGTGIFFDSAGNALSLIRNIRLNGSFINIHMKNASSWQISNSYIVSPTGGSGSYNMYIESPGAVDTGDQWVSGCTFDSSTAAVAHIYQVSGGGLKIQGSKFLSNNVSYGYLSAFVSGTSVLVINGNSFEGKSNIHIGTASGASFSKIAITGNQFGNTNVSIAGNSNPGVTSIQGAVISGNIFHGGPSGTNTASVLVTYGIGVMISGNQFFKVSEPDYAISILNSSLVDIGANDYYGWTTGATAVNGIPQTLLLPSNILIDGYTAGTDLTLGDATNGGGLFINGKAGVAYGYNINTTSGNDLIIQSNRGSSIAVTFGSLGALSACDLIDLGTCDYVFEPGYKLMALDDLSHYIKANSRLPGINTPNGVSVSELYEKTEEQALYILQLHERIKSLEAKHGS